MRPIRNKRQLRSALKGADKADVLPVTAGFLDLMLDILDQYSAIIEEQRQERHGQEERDRITREARDWHRG
jgi:hypothetical protein